MPTSLHPQAKFDPISPDLDLSGLVDRTPNFKWVQRVSRSQIRNLGQLEFEKLVLIHVVAGGRPLVIEGWDAVLPKWLFNVDWLEKSYDKKEESVRDIQTASDIPMTTGHYLRSMKQLANQWTPHNFRDERRQRLYLKDIDCPAEWHSELQKVIHPNLFYLNDNASGFGKTDVHNGGFLEETTVAPVGDLMSSLPEEMRAQNLMCYIGHEGTYTPAHREMCASLGQNIMVEASTDNGDEKKGSSIWFMTESKDREVVREYFLSMLGHDIEIEKHFAQINAWKKAPFDVYVVEQKVGDFILIPPLAAHQVWNRGTRTMKVAWNRTTAETLELALHEALPKARLVCRDEQYKNKAIVHFTLKKYHRQLLDMEEKAEMAQVSFLGLGQEMMRNSPRAKQLAGDFKKLFGLFTEILLDEMFAFKESNVELITFESCITCSYCRSNIFNRFLTCKHCVRTLDDGEEDAYDVCMECYAMGRSCACMSNLQWCEQWSWPELVKNYDDWRSMVIMNDGFVDIQSSPQPLEVARLNKRTKSVAQICQEALRRRPWKDITKQERENTPSESEPDGEEKPKKRKRKKKRGEVRRCHVCAHKDYSYRVHSCTNPGCSESYCYGVLYRAFDMMPQKVLEDEQWQCPKCLGICNCGYCRRVGNTNPYMPKNTLLGHDTRPIADDRSVEALVDFRVHNLSWLKAAGEESRSKDSKRMKRLREQADNAKAQDITEQAEADRAMQDGPKNANVVNIGGYGDQSHVLGQVPVMTGPGEPFQSFCEDGNGYMDESGLAMEISQEEDIDTSLYPDPSPVVSRQRIGMGYYEQDDTPDKILFDPFQAPSESAMRLPEPNIPEFVKKSIRAAKRKAKRDNEDPDFVVGKNHHKKPRLTAELEFLESMDPSLLGSFPINPEETMQEPGPSSEEQALDRNADDETSKATPEKLREKKMIMPRYDANEPSLRHAKPRTSYIELDDGDFDESEEESSQHMNTTNPPPALDSTKDAVDLAADTVRALFKGLENAAGNGYEQPTDTVEPKPVKRRGRPPKHSSSTPSTPTKGSIQSEAIKSTKSAKRPRGRPRRSNLYQVATANDVTQSHGSTAKAPNESSRPILGEQGGDNSDYDNDHDKRVKELEAHLTKELAADALEAAPRGSQQPRRGRPRKSGVTTIAAATAEAEMEVFREESNVSTPKASDRRVARSTSTGANTQLLSMAERMALQGKKFKMGQRKPQRTSKGITVALPSSPAIATREASAVDGNGSSPKLQSTQLIIQQSAPGAEYRSEDEPSSDANSRSPTPPQPRRQPGQPTVVRLVETDSEAESSIDSSDSDSDSDGDIPARGRGADKTSSTRGRGQGQARGRGRGRSRGRGRGRGRL